MKDKAKQLIGTTLHVDGGAEVKFHKCGSRAIAASAKPAGKPTAKPAAKPVPPTMDRKAIEARSAELKQFADQVRAREAAVAQRKAAAEAKAARERDARLPAGPLTLEHRGRSGGRRFDRIDAGDRQARAELAKLILAGKARRTATGHYVITRELA